MQDHQISSEYVETLVIGGGQAGLAVGHELKKRGRPFLILDAHPRVGEAWRRRWDSLLLFTPARYNRLPGMRFRRTISNSIASAACLRRSRRGCQSARACGPVKLMR